jgi:hypothetical protein
MYKSESFFKISVDLQMPDSKWEYLIEGFSGKPENWVQINTATNKKRPMKRVV